MAEEAKKKDRSRWFREMKSELKKIVWTDRKTVVKNTGTVLLCSLLIGVCIWVFDYVLVNGVQLLITALS
ncbi:preprotein translocase subunit SecE [uncultured Oscillibacter sp.]|uniref:preprotein translocase subunit SecE n=1 Tax=uncultured Oscillibacter sp. TaxID=876091 RepID=UPI0025DD7485|nr:preprotein translocase subunit SecE [uncultured Oscillibacter sp.]